MSHVCTTFRYNEEIDEYVCVDCGEIPQDNEEDYDDELNRTCPYCEGTGASWDGLRECDYCDGMGYKWWE